MNCPWLFSPCSDNVQYLQQRLYGLQSLSFTIWPFTEGFAGPRVRMLSALSEGLPCQSLNNHSRKASRFLARFLLPLSVNTASSHSSICSTASGNNTVPENTCPSHPLGLASGHCRSRDCFVSCEHKMCKAHLAGALTHPGHFSSSGK